MNLNVSADFLTFPCSTTTSLKNLTNIPETSGSNKHVAMTFMLCKGGTLSFLVHEVLRIDSFP